MELILWRHAEAEMGEPDLERALTGKGHKQALKMGAWLDRNLPHSCRILASPSKRTVQTAQALGRKFKILPELSPDAEPGALLAAANWPDSRETVLIVGHQPTLGRVAALLLSGIEQDWSIRKATAWWIVQRERGDNATNYLKAIMPPELATK